MAVPAGRWPACFVAFSPDFFFFFYWTQKNGSWDFLLLSKKGPLVP